MKRPYKKKIIHYTKEFTMNKLALLIVSTLLSASLMAQTNTTPTPSTDTTDTAKSKTTKTKKKEQKIYGIIKSIDLIGNKIIIETGNREDTVRVDSSTVVKVAGKDVKISKLVNGAKVFVTYKTEEGKKIAQKIIEKIAEELEK